MTVLLLRVNQVSPRAGAEGTDIEARANKRGELVVSDFYTQMGMDGLAYQVRAGTITTPLVGDVPLADAAAEMCVDAPLGRTIMPVYLNIAIRLGTGTLHEYAAKSVGVVSSAGAAFVPLPLKMGGGAALSTARVAAAGGVTVTVEVDTTTRRHWAYANPVAVGAGNSASPLEWIPRVPPPLTGPACFYVQIAATGTGPSYYASFDFIELPTVNI